MTPAATGAGLLRPRYFDRQQLSAADLMLAQEYVIERLRRHNRMVHGWGVIYGAEVSATSDGLVVNVSPGYALTPLGDEIFIPDAVTLDISEGLQECFPSADPCSHEGSLVASETDNPVFACARMDDMEIGPVPNPFNREGMIFEVLSADGARVEQATITASLDIHGLDNSHVTEVTLPFPSAIVNIGLVLAASSVVIWAFNSAGSEVAVARIQNEDGGPQTITISASDIVRLTITAPNNEVIITEVCATRVEALREVHIIACPRTDTMCPTPAVPDACQPPGGVYEWSRVRESYSLGIVCDLPASHQPTDTSCDDLTSLLCGSGSPQLPPDPGPEDNCVVLATLTVGGPSTSVDNVTHRRTLLNEALEREALRCLCEQRPEPTVPPTLPTVITRPTDVTIAPTITPTIAPTTRPTSVTIGPVTIPSFFTVATIGPITQFTLPTLEPVTRPTRITLGPITDIIGRPGPIFDDPRRVIASPAGVSGLDPEEFDLVRGARTPLETVSGIGPERGARLRDAGVGSALELAAMPIEQLTEVLGVSEVRAAGFQDAARNELRR